MLSGRRDIWIKESRLFTHPTVISAAAECVGGPLQFVGPVSGREVPTPKCLSFYLFIFDRECLYVALAVQELAMEMKTWL